MDYYKCSNEELNNLIKSYFFVDAKDDFNMFTKESEFLTKKTIDRVIKENRLNKGLIESKIFRIIKDSKEKITKKEVYLIRNVAICLLDSISGGVV